MGLSDAQFVAVSDSHTLSSLRCPICHEVFDNPVFCSNRPCQCTFCENCILLALRHKQACPMDRQAMSAADLTTHHFVKGLVDGLEVFCSNRALGCYWTGRLDGRPRHEEACLARRVHSLEAQLAERELQLKSLQGVVDAVEGLLAGRAVPEDAGAWEPSTACKLDR